MEDLNVKWLRNTIGLVSQEPAIFAATVEENLKLGRVDISDNDMIRACRMSHSHEFIKKLPHGYKTRIGDGGIKLVILVLDRLNKAGQLSGQVN